MANLWLWCSMPENIQFHRLLRFLEYIGQQLIFLFQVIQNFDRHVFVDMVFW